jgi:hypothetical protein
MKTKILIMLTLVPMLAFAQIKGKKSKDAFTTSQGTEYKVGDVIKLGKASNGEKFAFAYVKKSALSIGNIKKAMKSVQDVKSMNVSNVSSITNTVNTVNNLANNELAEEAISKLMGKAVSPSYVEKNALDTSMEGKKLKIKQFKIFTDKETGETIVHAIAKGGGKNVAVLLELAEKSGEIQ